MIKTIQSILALPAIFIRLMYDIKLQKRFMKQYIDPILLKAQINNDGSLTPKDFNKINKYYSLAVPAIIGEAFCILRGSKMTDNERIASTCQGAITGLFDDFFDNLKLPESQISELVNNPETILTISSNINLYLEFYKLSLANSKFPARVKKQLMLVNKAQINSVEQENPKITKKRIEEITKLKGGQSVLFYRTAFNSLPVKGESDALFLLGSLMQFENDIFDLYKDNKAGIQTLPVILTNTIELRLLYEQNMIKFINACYKINYPRKNIVRFLNRVMPVINRGFVCLDSYNKLQKNNDGIFDVDSFSRKQLICDMEKTGNFLKTIKYQLLNNYKPTPKTGKPQPNLA